MLPECGNIVQKACGFYPQLQSAYNLLLKAPKEVEDLKKELEKLHDGIMEAAKQVAEAEEGRNRDIMKNKATSLITLYFRIEDVIEEWILCDQREKVNERCSCTMCGKGCVTLPCGSAEYVNMRCCDRFQIARKVEVIKQELGIINGGTENKSSSEQKLTKNPDVAWLFMTPTEICYPGITEIVGFKAQSDKLISWLEDGNAKSNVTVVVGMAGQGKTTLVKQIYENEEVIGNFDGKVWICISSLNSPKQFFSSMLKELCEGTGLPPGFDKLDLESLKNTVKKQLHNKRYVLFFDDVWNKQFWKEIEHIIGDNKNGSRIIITTRNKEVAKPWNMSSVVDVKVHEMQPLTREESLKLFCQVAFKFDIDKNSCPKRFENISDKIVKTCDGLPLGLVAIGNQVPIENTNTFNWKSKIQVSGIRERLGLSYDYLPNHLKQCLLYFGIYPPDYVVKSKRLIRQWIAEGFVFVNHENGKTIEEVGEDYLTGLIDRNLVQVSSFTIDGKPKCCRVHWLVHDMILRKSEDLSFCLHINDYDRSANVSEIARHLSIATNSHEELPDFLQHSNEIESSFIRSLHIFSKEKLPQHFLIGIPTKYKPLKVLDFENSNVSYDFEDLGCLIHLKYLSFRNTQVRSLPKSIGKLMNLETLDLRESEIKEVPKEVSKLRKLRHLLGTTMSMIQLKDDVRDMRCLETLRDVKIEEEVGLIERMLEKLWQIRDLGLNNVGEEHGSALCSAINKMENLMKLSVIVKSENEVIELHDLRNPSNLQKLRLQGRLSTLPSWVPDHGNLVKLVLSGSRLTDDPFISLKGIPNLLFLSISNEAYQGENLDFQAGGFEELRKLEIGSLSKLKSINIHNEALPSLRMLTIKKMPELKRVPSGIQYLKNLQDLNYEDMPTEFVDSISSSDRQTHGLRINGVLVTKGNSDLR